MNNTLSTIIFLSIITIGIGTGLLIGHILETRFKKKRQNNANNK